MRDEVYRDVKEGYKQAWVKARFAQRNSFVIGYRMTTSHSVPDIL